MERKTIGIISGKGGVGKTSLCASLTSLANKDSEINPIIVDCDVDAPNLALLLPSDDNHYRTKDIYGTLKSSFIQDKCTQCKKCIDDHFCEFNALSWDDELNFPKVNYLACEGCSACKVLCPEHAFDINSVKSGEIIDYKTNLGIEIVYGETNLGSTTSGKLVSDVKDHVKSIESYSNSNLIIIDGPPGIGCPVIAMVSGLDYVIAITEPTPSGLHDLLRALEVIQQFKIPFSIVINKSDLKSSFQEKFKEFIGKYNYDIIGKIPFDLAIPKAMSFAQTVVDYAPDTIASVEIKEIYQKMKKRLWQN